MNNEFKPEDEVLLRVKVRYITKEGTLDLKLKDGTIIYGVEPDEVMHILGEE